MINESSSGSAGFTSVARREAKSKSTGHKIVGCVDCRMIVVVDQDKQPSFGLVDAKGWHCKGLFSPPSRG